MAGEGEKATPRKVSNRSDELASSPARLHQRQANGSSLPAEDLKPQQPAFKKPRLDVSLIARELSLLDVDGNIVSLRSMSSNGREQSKDQMAFLNDQNVKDAMDTSAPASDGIVGECSTCGDVGFHTELFRCSKGCSRLQHTYCSNSYNPRKRWFIGLCNWCEAEVAATARAAGTVGASKLQLHGSRRDAPWSSTSRVERTHAVECLLGAALRLPSAGFSSVEDLLQVEPLAGSGIRRKPPSFDSVEKAKRSGPSADNDVKTSKRVGKVEICGIAAASVGRSSSSSAENSESQEKRSPSGDENSAMSKPKRSPSSSSEVGTLQTSSPAPGDTKAGKLDLLHQVEQRRSKEESSARKASSSDSSEKLLSRQSPRAEVALVEKVSRLMTMKVTGEAASALEKVRHCSARGMETKSPKCSPANARSSNDERSSDCSSLESGSKLKRRSSAHDSADKSVVESHASKSRMSGMQRKDSFTRKNVKASITREGGSDAPTQPLKINPENVEKTKKPVGQTAAEKVLRVSEERISPDNLRNRPSLPENSGGSVEVGLDASNITLEQKTVVGKDTPSSPRKRTSKVMNISSNSRQLVRPNYVIGKPARSNATDEKLHRKIFSHKDSNNKLRRASSKISGFHNNYKSLSDILC